MRSRVQVSLPLRIENQALAVLQVLFSLQNLAESVKIDHLCGALWGIFGALCGTPHLQKTCKKWLLFL